MQCYVGKRMLQPLLMITQHQQLGCGNVYEEENEYYVNTRNTARNKKLSACERFLAEETISSVEALAQCRL